VEWYIYPVVSGESRAEMRVIHFLDMSERKMAETLMNERENKYLALFYRSSDLVYIHDFNGRLIDANPALLHLLGYTRTEISGIPITTFVDNDQLVQARKTLDEIREQGYQAQYTEYRLKSRYGSEIHIQTSGFLIYHGAKPYAILQIGRDITDRKKNLSLLDFIARCAMEFVQMSSEEDVYGVIARKLREIIGNAVISVGSFDESSNMLETRVVLGIDPNLESIVKFWGRNPVGMTYHLNESQKEPIRTGTLTHVQGGLHELSFGSIPKIACRILETMFSVNRVYGIGFTSKGFIYGVATVITFKNSPPIDVELVEAYCSQASIALQRWMAEKTLRKTEEVYQKIIDNNRDVIYTMDINGILRFVSPQIARYGYSPDAMVSHSILDLIVSEDCARARMELETMLVAGQEVNSQFRVIDAGGVVHWVEDSRMVQKDTSGAVQGIIGNIRDISDRKNAEDALKISEKKLLQQKNALEQKTIALREIIEQIEIEKTSIKKDVMTNVNEILFPILDRLQLKDGDNDYVVLIKELLENLTSPMGRKLTVNSLRLTPREIEVCTLIERGLSTKEISHILSVSARTVENHRKNIRHKLKITNKDINLVTYLQQL